MTFVFSLSVSLSLFFLNASGSDAALVSPNQLRVDVADIRQEQDDERVVGGSNAEPNQFPYIVSLRQNRNHICGGSILSRYWIVTAAHCVFSASARELDVSVGSIMLSDPAILHPVANYIIHEDYHRFDIINDVAILRLEKALTFTLSVQAIEMSTADLAGNTPCILAGWGRTNNSIPQASEHLHFVALRTLLHAECRRLLAEFPIQMSQVCTLTQVGEGACRGDSGGPLVSTDDKLIGIVSYGRPCAKGYPDVFTRISSFIPWINKHIEAQ